MHDLITTPGFFNLVHLALGGLLAVAVFVLHWHTVRRVIPDLNTAHRNELAETRAAFLGELKAVRESHERNLTAIASRLEGVEQRLGGLERHEDYARPFFQREAS